MSMIYGILTTVEAAQEAAQELVDIGFLETDITFVSQADDEPVLVLRHLRIPGIEASLYARRIRQGSVLIHVIVHGRAEHARVEELFLDLGVSETGWSPGTATHHRLPLERESASLIC